MSCKSPAARTDATPSGYRNDVPRALPCGKTDDAPLALATQLECRSNDILVDLALLDSGVSAW